MFAVLKMAPKKNVTDLPVVKKRGRKEKPMKPPLQTPTLITVQFTNSGKFTKLLIFVF